MGAEGERRFHPWAVEVVEAEVRRHLLRVAWAAGAEAARWNQLGHVREAEEGAEELRRRLHRNEAAVVVEVVQRKKQRRWKQ